MEHRTRIRRSDGRRIVSYCGRPECPGRRRCRLCRNVYQNDTRPAHREMTDEQRKRANCRSFTLSYQRRGLLPAGPCDACGDPLARNVHYWGYDNPRWFLRLCRTCKRALDAAVNSSRITGTSTYKE